MKTIAILYYIKSAEEKVVDSVYATKALADGERLKKNAPGWYIVEEVELITKPTQDNTPTEVERELLSLAADGMTSKETARKLNRAEATIKFQKTALMRKIGAKTITQAVAISIRNGWIK